MAVGQNLLNGFSRIGWGLIYDKIGFRRSYLIISLTVVIFVSTLPLLPYLGKFSIGSSIITDKDPI